MNRTRMAAKLVKVSLIGLAVIAIAAYSIRQWLVPIVLVSQIEAISGCKVEIQSWWIDRRSAGVVGLRLIEGGKAGARAFAEASRITTDLSLGELARGRFIPRKVTLENPSYIVLLDKDGRLLTKLGAATSGEQGLKAIPSIVVQRGTVTFRQEGRPEMVVRQVTARVDPDSNGLALAARTSDPEWGPLQAFGHFSRDFATGKLELRSTGAVSTNPSRVRCIPFVPKEVWENVLPEGDVKLEAALELVADPKPSVHLETKIDLLGTSVRSPSLDLDVKGATGRVTLRDGLVSLNRVEGKALGGKVGANGSLDFEPSIPRVDLMLEFGGVEVADAPARWQLGEAGATGRLTGSARLIALLKPTGIDLTGSSGEGEVKDGEIQGIPIKSMKLAMKAQGDDLQYQTPSSDPSTPPETRRGGSRFAELREILAVAIQSQDLPKIAPSTAPAAEKPKVVSTVVEFEDVDIAKVIARAQLVLRSTIPIPISGRFSLKATATIPIGRIKDVKLYAFHGDLKLSGARIDGVDVEKVEARLDLADGRLELSNLQGILGDKPDGGSVGLPAIPPTYVSVERGLPRGGFRGSLKAELSPLGRGEAKLEGNDLPLGELAEAFFATPTPITGVSDLNVEANVDLADLMRAEAWELSGTATGRSIRYESIALEASSAKFALKDGVFHFDDVTALLEGKLLKGRAKLAVKPPGRFEATIDVNEWGLASLFKWVPGVSPSLAVGGRLSGEASAVGTLSPFHVATMGSARIKGFQANSIALGDLAGSWETLKEVVHVKLVDDQKPGGGFKAEGLVPLVGDEPVHGTIELTSFDVKRVSGLIPSRSLDLSGRFDGQGNFTIPRGASMLDANLQVTSKEMRLKGLPAEQVEVHVLAERGELSYKLKGASLGGTMSLNGRVPLSGEPANQANQPNGVFQTVNFQIEPIFKAIGMTGPLAKVQGRGAIDANLRASIVGKPHLMARGVAEFRDLTWASKRPVALGLLKSVVELSPESWRLDPIGGTILGGRVSGLAWGTFLADGARLQDFDLKIEHASLDQIEHFAPAGLPRFAGQATIHVTGSASESLRAHVDVTVPQATVEGIRIREVKFPVTLVSDASGNSGVAHARQWTARVAGGAVRGDSTFRMGETHSFRTDVQLNDLELESFARLMTDARQPASGKISGRIALLGSRPDSPKSYRGHVNLDLSDASLVALPIFREIDKFLGSARGGLFEDGNLNGEIANGQFNVSSLTLQGRVAQLHATGTMGLDGQVDLGVLVNTSQLIPQTGKALAALIPGLGALSGRNRSAATQFAGFLSNRLLKLRVTGTIRNPSVSLDPSVGVADSAVSFFGGVLNLPAGIRD